MKRREFIGLVGGAAAWPLVARAQSKNNLVIGFLSPTSPELYQRPLAAFRDGLRETGFVEGQNVQIEYRWANGHYDRLAALATELVNLNVAVIYASGGDSSAVAAKQSTATIPVVVSPSSDPVKMGLVASLSHPGGNITGVSRLNIELFPKRLELLREAVPNASKIAVLINEANPNAAAVLRELESATHTFGSKSTTHLRPWFAKMQKPSSSVLTLSSTAAASNSEAWRFGTVCLPSISFASSLRLAGS